MTTELGCFARFFCENLVLKLVLLLKLLKKTEIDEEIMSRDSYVEKIHRLIKSTIPVITFTLPLSILIFFL